MRMFTFLLKLTMLPVTVLEMFQIKNIPNRIFFL
jgi:hypothetical protein